MREPDHIAACFLGDVGEVTVHNPGEFVSILPRWRLATSLCLYCSYSPFSASVRGRQAWLSYHSPAWLTTSRRIHLSRSPGR